MSSTILRVQDVSHTYNKGSNSVEAIRKINFSINQNEMVSVQGDSGSGKTTLLLACGGMLKPTEGSILLKGKDIFAIGSEERNKIRAKTIGYMFQTLQLVPYLSVLDNLLLHEKSSKTDAIEWLERFSLDDRIRHYPNELSHGQRQRVALIRAISHQPELLIADEPTGNLDPKNSQMVLEILRHFTDLGGAVLVASHDEAIASQSDRNLILKDKSLVESSNNNAPPKNDANLPSPSH